MYISTPTKLDNRTIDILNIINNYIVLVEETYAMNSNGMKNKNVTFTKSEAKSINTILDEYGRNDIEYVFKRIDGTIILICFNGDVENKTIFKNEKEFLEQIVQDELTTNYKDFYNVIYDDVEDYDIAANYKDFIFIGCADL